MTPAYRAVPASDSTSTPAGSEAAAPGPDAAPSVSVRTGGNFGNVKKPAWFSQRLRPAHRWYGPLRGLPAAVALCLLPLVGFAVWIPLDVRNSGQIGLASVAVGGTLTQIEAKVIDVLCSVVFAPLVVFCLNKSWFSTARVSILNERITSGGVPLATVVEASNTDSGSYSPDKILRLVRSKMPAMFLLGVLVFLSAIVFSTLSNMIAYEAFVATIGDSSVSLRGLGDLSQPSFGIPPHIYDPDEEANFLSQWMGLMVGVAFHNATDKLDDDNYIGINATQASQDAIPSNTTVLYSVPAYRLAIECKAQPPDMLGIVATDTYEVQIKATFNSSDNSSQIYQAEYPGQGDIAEECSVQCPFIGFSSDQDQIYLGFLGSVLDFQEPVPSPYGDITYTTHNMSASGFNGTNEIMYSWGFRCNVTRQTGLHNLARQADLSWKITNSTWVDSKENTKVLLGYLQMALNFQSPTSFIPGLAPAFLSSAINCTEPLDSDGDCPGETSIDYRVNALNFLYAAGETERIALEIKNTASQGDGELGDGSSSFQVQATLSDLRYRMTYVPLLLLIALLSLLFAASISLVLAISARRTASFRAWRDVNSLRLLVDGVDGLRDEPSLSHVHSLSNKQIEKWAQKFRVGYHAIETKDELDEGSEVRLSKILKKVMVKEQEYRQQVRLANKESDGSG